MDWIIPLITAGAGLGGALIAEVFMFWSQRNAQRNENARNARRLAYEAALAVWHEHRHKFTATSNKNTTGADVEDEIQPFEDYLIHNLVFADATLGKINADSSHAELEEVLRTARTRSYFLRDLRDNLRKEGMERGYPRVMAHEE